MTTRVELEFKADAAEIVAANKAVQEAIKKTGEAVRLTSVSVSKDMTVSTKAFTVATTEAATATKEFSLSMINLRDAGSAFVIIAADMRRFIQESIDAFVDFDKVVQQTAALATELGSAVSTTLREDIAQAAREMAVQFNQDIGKTITALQELVAMGFSVEDAMKLLKVGAQSAVAGLGDIDQTTKLLANTLRSFGIDIEDVSTITAIFTYISNQTSLTMNDFTIAMQYAGAQAGQMGFSLEEVASVLGVMKDAGLEASIAGTTLRQFLVRIQDPVSESRALLDELGIALTNDAGEFLSLTQIMKNVDTATRDMTDAQRAQVIATLFETRGQAAFNLTMAQGIERLESLTAGAAEMNDETVATNLLTETSNKMLDSAAVRYEQVRKEMEITAAIIGEKLAPMETSLLSIQNSLVRSLVQLPGGFGTANAFLLQLSATVLGSAGQFFLLITSIQTAHKSLKNIYPSIVSMFKALTGGGEITEALTKKIHLLKFSLVGLGLAYAGVALFTQAVNAKSNEERAIFSALTGVTWGLAIASMVHGVAQQLQAGPLIGIALATAAGVAMLTFIAAAQASAKPAQRGALVMAKPGEGQIYRVGEGASNEIIAPEPMLRSIIRDELRRNGTNSESASSDTFIFNIPPTQRMTDREAREIAEITSDIRRRRMRQVA